MIKFCELLLLCVVFATLISLYKDTDKNRESIYSMHNQIRDMRSEIYKLEDRLDKQQIYIF